MKREHVSIILTEPARTYARNDLIRRNLLTEDDVFYGPSFACLDGEQLFAHFFDHGIQVTTKIDGETLNYHYPWHQVARVKHG